MYAAIGTSKNGGVFFKKGVVKKSTIMLEIDILPEEYEGYHPLQLDSTELAESSILFRSVKEMRNHIDRKRVIVLFSCDKVIIHF